MFFKNFTVYKTYGTRKGAETYMARYGLNNDPAISIEEFDGRFWVVAA